MDEDDLISRLSLDSNNSSGSKVRVKAAGDNQFTFELNDDTAEDDEDEEEEEEDVLHGDLQSLASKFVAQYNESPSANLSPEDANKQSTQTLTIRFFKRREAIEGMMVIFNSGDWTQALGSSDFCITTSQQQELSSRCCQPYRYLSVVSADLIDNSGSGGRWRRRGRYSEYLKQFIMSIVPFFKKFSFSSK